MSCPAMQCHAISFFSEPANSYIVYRKAVRIRVACSSTSVRTTIKPIDTATTGIAALKVALLFFDPFAKEHG
jgi:hypothetical protein